MDHQTVSPQKKPKSPISENINIKTSITCTKVPETLFDAKAAEKHFSKFGRVQKIRLFPKTQKCVVEYSQAVSAERAILNAGAYDGFMFDVTKMKPKLRTKRIRDHDPDWVPDEDVEEELSAMRGIPTYRPSRQKSMQLEMAPNPARENKHPIRRAPIKSRVKPVIKQPASGKDYPVAVVTVPTSLNTAEAAEQLNQLRYKVSLTPDDQWRTLDARDRILRSWGGAGSRLKVGGATIGTCPDMCPEKERLHRQAEHQVMTLETVLESDGKLEPAWAIKQYSRSSADQEMPMCYELRPPRVLMNTAEHLRQIADTQRQVSLADWFHFMWDRFRSIRKDIAQQALCCADSIRLVEICARFHAHCAARLADLEHTQFDQKLNTDNLTKCLQTLKHMYTDVRPHMKPNEAEFRGYIALLNLGDANFWWEIKQLPQEIQKSESIIFALNVFTALDNNNYVKFFRLVREKATYLQACILLRYFNDVRARALARIVKAYAPKGGYLHPAHNIMNNLAFENIESMESFIDHYGLRFAKTSKEFIILDRKHFIEDSDPFPMSRAVNLIESKRNTSVGNVICGGKLPPFDSANHQLYSSFSSNGKIKETALLAEDLGYNTTNDTDKDIQLLKAELMKLTGGNISSRVLEKANEPQKTLTSKMLFSRIPSKIPNVFIDPGKQRKEEKQFSFQPAIPVAPVEHLKSANETDFEMNVQNSFTFSKPQEMNNVAFSSKNLSFSSIAESQAVDKSSVFAKSNKLKLDDFKKSQNPFKTVPPAKSIFAQAREKKTETTVLNNTIFSNANVPPANDAIIGTKNIFAQASNSGLFKSQGTADTTTNIFSKSQEDTSKNPSSIFGCFKESSNTNRESEPKAPSPGTLFKSFNQQAPLATAKHTIFTSNSKPSTVTDNIFSSRNVPNANVSDFDQKINEYIDKSYISQQKEEEDRILQERARKEEMDRITENQRKQEEEKRKLEEHTRKQEEQKNLEELKRLEEKLEEKRLAEEKRKAEEKEKLFTEKVESESTNLMIELLNTITDETVRANLAEEIEIRDKLVSYAEEVTEEISFELINELCNSELKAELFRTNSLMKKWYHVWRKHFIRNSKRRSLLKCTPVWLTDKTPQEEAAYLKRPTESCELRNIKAICNGYKFSVKLNKIPPPLRFKLVDIIREPFLKRAKHIKVAYEKCFFWKLTIISTGSSKWIYKKINIDQWIVNAFSDKKEYDISKSLLYVGKESWNNLLDFAISISMMGKEESSYGSEAFEGSNGILLYVTNTKDIEILKETIIYRYPYQILPIAIMIASEQVSIKVLEDELCMYKCKNIISDYKLFLIEPTNLGENLNMVTKKALKWIAKSYPIPPPLEIDYLKSICQRYLGREIWCILKHKDRNLNDLFKLISYYNKAVDKLTEVITNEDLINYTTFPLEFKQYLNDMSPYPKPYEYIGSNVKNLENVSAIKRFMEKLRLPLPTTSFAPLTGCNINVKEQVQTYCQQIRWFENPEEVACKVVALLPSEDVMTRMPYQEFSENYQHYDIKDTLNLIVYEKIKELHNFENRLAIYLKPELKDYRCFYWLHNTDQVSIDDEDLKYEDEIDSFIEAKRRKIAIDSMGDGMLKDSDCALFEEYIQKVDSNIEAYSQREASLLQLEKLLDEEKKKSDALENLLRTALTDV